MYKKAIVYTVATFIITMIILRFEVAIGLLPVIALNEVVIVIVVSLFIGAVVFFINKKEVKFWQLVDDNLDSQPVGDYLFGKLSRRKLMKILREEKE